MKRFLLALLVSVGLPGFCQAAHATTYYVAVTGNDANPGSVGAPFRTIQKGADVVNPGDTVSVDDGAYTDTDGNGIIVYMLRGGTSSAWVTFKSKNKWGAKVDGLHVTKHGFYFGAQYIRVQDFEVTAEQNEGGPDGFASSTGDVGIQIVGNHIHDIGRVCSDSAFGFDGVIFSATNVTVEKNIIHDIGRFAPGENGCNPATTYYQNNDHGLYIAGGQDISIKNNIFYNNARGWSVHIYPNAVSNVRILDNTFADPNPYRVGQITVNANLTTVDFANNIFYSPTTAGIRFASGVHSGVTVRNNLTNVASVQDVTPAGVTVSGSVVNASPGFVNSATRDYHLLSTSLAINAGVTIAEVTDDFDGVTRPQGSAYDIGAYEFVTAGFPPNPATGLGLTWTVQ
jgi:hypothetical protein